MIKANELRVGNWVECQFTAKDSIYHKVTGITEENIFLDAITFDYLTLEDIEPIPLTEEILLSAGFEKWGKWYVIFDLYIDLYGNMCIDKFVLPYKSPKHLHQLQNLYFALTGQELEVQN